MKTLLMILAFLDTHGLTLDDFSIQTVRAQPGIERVYDCDGFPDKDATILVCQKQKLIIIHKN